jgi:hypothetical protein
VLQKGALMHAPRRAIKAATIVACARGVRERNQAPID